MAKKRIPQIASRSAIKANAIRPKGRSFNVGAYSASTNGPLEASKLT